MLFLDFDGTLAPIVARPEQARLPRKTSELLKALSENKACKIAIVSGRALEDIKRKVGLEGLVYVGNHGLELEGPDLRYTFFEFCEFRGVLDNVTIKLADVVRRFEGAFIEDKGISLSLHFRLVSPKKMLTLTNAVREALIHYIVKNQIKVKRGKMVLEIRPPIIWDKGKAVLWLKYRWECALADKAAVAVYVGDDTTDEDAFKAIKNKGLAIFVGEPKESHAQYYLKDHNEVQDFLERISGIMPA